MRDVLAPARTSALACAQVFARAVFVSTGRADMRARMARGICTGGSRGTVAIDARDT